MEDNSTTWIGKNNLNSFGIAETPPMSEQQLLELLDRQRRDKTHTDQDGYFIQGCAQMLNIELRILSTRITSEILESGIGGPIQIINKSSDCDRRHIFYVGLLQNEDRTEGHYQGGSYNCI